MSSLYDEERYERFTSRPMLRTPRDETPNHDRPLVYGVPSSYEGNDYYG